MPTEVTPHFRYLHTRHLLAKASGPFHPSKYFQIYHHIRPTRPSTAHPYIKSKNTKKDKITVQTAQPMSQPAPCKTPPPLLLPNPSPWGPSCHHPHLHTRKAPFDLISLLWSYFSERTKIERLCYVNKPA